MSLDGGGMSIKYNTNKTTINKIIEKELKYLIFMYRTQ